MLMPQYVIFVLVQHVAGLYVYSASALEKQSARRYGAARGHTHPNSIIYLILY